MTRPAAYGDPIVTGEAVAIDLRPAGIGSRGIAFVVDVGVQLIATFVLVWLVIAVGSTVDSAGALAVLVTFYVGIWLGYPVLLETLWHGRTLGKAAMGLRVVRDDGGPIRFRHAFVRGLVGLVVDRPGLSAGFLAIVPMLVSARSKRMGDLAAGTIVIQERVPQSQLPTPVVPAGLEGWAASLDLTGVDDTLALELRHFLARAPQLAPWARESMGARLHGELAARIGPAPETVPPWLYLSAVLAERHRREIARLRPPATAPATPVVRPTPPSPDRAGPADGFAPPG